MFIIADATLPIGEILAMNIIVEPAAGEPAAR
jgi:hypothetical protein